MSDLGTIVHLDLTVENAETVRDFYCEVLGWTATPLSMGDYDDYVMVSPDGEHVGGVCHARGENAGMPPVWISYVKVPDLDAALEAVRRSGGEVRVDPKGDPGAWRFAVIADPAGALLGLFWAPAEGTEGPDGTEGSEEADGAQGTAI